MFAVIMLLATIMAVFGVLGYLKGSKWAFIALLILLVGFVLVENRPETIVSTLNGMYLGVMLTLRGGLGAIASGDLDEAKALLDDITRPFNQQNANLALLLVIFGAVGVGLLFSLAMKSKPSAWGLLWGLLYGYILSAAALPLIFTNTSLTLPVPILRPAEPATTAAAVNQGANPVDQLLTTLGQPQNVQVLGIMIGAFIVLLLLLTVRSGVKGGAKKKG